MHFLRSIRRWRRVTETRYPSSVAPAPVVTLAASPRVRVVLPPGPKRGASEEVKDEEVEFGGYEDFDVCAICLDAVHAFSMCTLPCSHSYHSSCVSSLRASSAANLCPLCRMELPPSAVVLYDRAMSKYFAVERNQAAESSTPWVPEIEPGTTLAISIA